MTMFTVDDTAVRHLLAQLSSDEQWTEVAVQIAQEAQALVSPYPPVRRQRQPFVSEKQRRWFFWALANGIIEVPYRRGLSPGSEDMINRWAITPQRPGATLSNEATYASYVIGAKSDQQARYHRGNWKSTDEMVKAIDDSDMVVRIVTDYVAKQDQS